MGNLSRLHLNIQYHLSFRCFSISSIEIEVLLLFEHLSFYLLQFYARLGLSLYHIVIRSWMHTLIYKGPSVDTPMGMETEVCVDVIPSVNAKL